MPLYEYRCKNTNKRFERFVPLQNFQAPQLCSCGGEGLRVISSVRINVESVDYQCPITGKHISSKYDHEENLKLHDCRVLETGEKEASERFRQQIEADFDRKVEETVEKEFEAMSSDKKEKLANELTSGLDVAVERR